jgi:hypothetical protein
MRTFACFFTDSRYSVPTLSFYLTSDGERARELARRELAANANYLGFEVREGQRLLFVEGECEGVQAGSLAPRGA